MAPHEIAMSRLCVLVEDGRSIREIADILRITTFAARMCWFAQIDGGPSVKLCPKCCGAGAWSGQTCKPCHGTGVEGGA